MLIFLGCYEQLNQFQLHSENAHKLQKNKIKKSWFQVFVPMALVVVIIGIGNRLGKEHDNCSPHFSSSQIEVACRESSCKLGDNNYMVAPKSLYGSACTNHGEAP